MPDPEKTPRVSSRARELRLERDQLFAMLEEFLEAIAVAHDRLAEKVATLKRETSIEVQPPPAGEP